MNEAKLRTIINVGTIVATIVLVALIIGLIFQFVNEDMGDKKILNEGQKEASLNPGDHLPLLGPKAFLQGFC